MLCIPDTGRDDTDDFVALVPEMYAILAPYFATWRDG